jgi:hypothetical protein
MDPGYHWNIRDQFDKPFFIVTVFRLREFVTGWHFQSEDNLIKLF